MPEKTAGGVSRSFLLMAACMSGAGILSLAASWRLSPPVLSVQATLLLIAVVVSENFAFNLSAFSISMSYPLTMAAILVAGPAAAGVIAAASSTNFQEVRSKRPLSVYACNMGQLLIVTGLGSWVYIALGGRILIAAAESTPLATADFPGILVPLLGAAVTCVAGNLTLTAVTVALLRGRPLVELLATLVAFAPSQLGLAFVGFLIGQVLTVNVFALPLFIVPLLVARQLYIRYTSMRTAFADTVKSLIGALEAKDHYTRGHSERVAEYAVGLGAALGLDARSLERLEYAALLHDLGKLSLPAAILRKPDALTDEERRQVVAHPDVGADMVARIPPLRDLAEPVRHHHERYAGGGYPSGASAAEAPAFGRILCIADSFDAMTTTRAYRPAMIIEAAIDELEAGAGTQFDPDMVGPFVEVVRGMAAAGVESVDPAVGVVEAIAVVT